MQALIDADIICYSCGFAAQKNVHRVSLKGEEEYGCISSFHYKKELKAWLEEKGLTYEDVVIETDLEVEPLENCLHSVKQSIRSILEETQSESYRLFLTGKGNFREEIATIAKYKGTRDEAHKPAHYEEIKKYLINVWNAEVVDGQEADDALGIAQWADLQKYIVPGLPLYLPAYAKTIICSIDKDLDMIPGNHYNFRKGERYWVEEEQAIKHFYTQLLTGDSVDNIIGIPGIGPKKAAKILEGIDDEFQMYVECNERYVEQYGDTTVGERALLENANLLWIRREEGQEWQPPI